MISVLLNKCESPLLFSPADKPRLSSLGQSVETEFEELACRSIDLTRRSPIFQHYTLPNEYGVRQVVPHFNPREGGVHLCTGSERLFFNAAQCPRRDGFIGVDLDPHIIAYNSFNALLLRLAVSREEYQFLATLPGEPDTIPWCERIALLKSRVETCIELSSAWKGYYCNNLEAFAKIYYPSKLQFFELVEQFPDDFIAYHQDQEAFDRLHSYAKSGSFVFLYRDINKLDFINASSVADVDISNIADYSLIDLQFLERGDAASGIRIIWTSHHHDCTNTRFFSWEHQQLTLEQKEEMQQLLSRLAAEKQGREDTTSWGQYLYFQERKEGACFLDRPFTDRSPHYSISLETLQRLRRHFQQEELSAEDAEIRSYFGPADTAFSGFVSICREKGGFRSLRKGF